MHTKVLLLLTVFSIASSSAFGQWEEDTLHGRDSVIAKITNLKWRKKLRVADDLKNQGNYLDAIVVYEMVNKDKPKELYTIQQLGECNYAIRNYKECVKWFGLLASLDSLKYPYSRYYLAKSLKYDGQYEKAIPEFERFHKKEFYFKDAVWEEKMKEVKSTVADEIAGCRLAMEFALKPPSKSSVENLGPKVNHPLTDLSPHLITDSLLLYAALLPDSAFEAHDTTKTRFTRMLVTARTANGWQAGELYDFPYNSGDYHVGNGVYSPDKQRFYFTRCSQREAGGMHCQIFESSFTNGAWSEPALLGEAVNGEFSSTHPMAALNSKGDEILFYSSNRSGGRGGFDIWVATRNRSTGAFTDLQNAGMVINTYYDDVTPYFDTKTKTLYYSSEGRINIGGFDIYYSKQDTLGNWGEPVNMGIPVNSSVDDIYFTLGEDRQKGFLVSNRPGGLSPKSPTCCDDIWAFRLPAPYVFVEGWVTDDSTGERIREGSVNFYDSATDSLIASAPITEDGYYKVRLPGERKFRVKATSPDYFDAETSISSENRDAGELLRADIKMKKRPYRVGLKMGIVYYDFDKSKLRDDARPVLNQVVAILKNYPAIIEIGGHTDEMGDVDYNMTLSQRRAEAVYNYLIREGVPKEQLAQKGYGETQPVAPNKKPDGSDNPQGRQLNRRAEFTVIGEMKVEKQ